MPLFNSDAARLDVVHVDGDDLSFDVTVLENGVAYDSTGATVTTAILDSSGTAQASNFTTSWASNVLTVALADDVALAAGTWRYYVKVTKGGVERTWLAGELSRLSYTRAGRTTTSGTATLELQGDTTISLAVTAGSGGGGGGSTNLSYTASPTNGVVASDTGTDATLTLAGGTNAGLMAPADYTKLAGIESGATADQSAAEILAALLTVDGAGSGLDADLLDGNSSAAFATSGHTHSGVYEPAGTVASHEADTTNVHGIADTSALLDTADIGSTVQAYDADLADIAGITRTKGDLIVGTSSGWTDLAVGTDGHVLTADSAQSAGVKWAAVSGGSGSVATDTIWDAKGDLAVGTGTDTASRLAVGADGSALFAASNDTTGTRWVSSEVPTLASATVYMVPPTFRMNSGSATASQASKMFILPIFVSRRLTVAALAVRVSTLEAGSTIRLGLYPLGADWAPGTLTVDYGTVSGASTGMKEATGSTVIDPGWYGIAAAFSNHTTIRTWSGTPTAGTTPLLGVTASTTGSAQHFIGWQESADYSAGLPSTTTASLIQSDSTVYPMLFARFS